MQQVLRELVLQGGEGSTGAEVGADMLALVRDLLALHLWRRTALPRDGGLQALGTHLAEASGLCC